MSAKKIVVPIDFSKTSSIALEYAVYVANRLNGAIYLLHVADRNALKGKAGTAAAYKHNIIKLERRLNDIKIKSGAAFRIETILKTTDDAAYKEIIDFSIKHDVELACIGTHSGSAKFNLGNNADKLVHEALFPVLTCGSKKEPIQFKNLLLPIDLTKHTQEKVERIIRFAKSFDAVIHLLAVSELLEQFITTKSQLEERMDEAAEAIRKNGLKCTTEMIRHDTVSHSVLEYATEIGADLLVIMSRQENKINQLLLGSRINKVISHAPIPVLSFRHIDEE